MKNKYLTYKNTILAKYTSFRSCFLILCVLTLFFNCSRYGISKNMNNNVPKSTLDGDSKSNDNQSAFFNELENKLKCYFLPTNKNCQEFKKLRKTLSENYGIETKSDYIHDLHKKFDSFTYLYMLALNPVHTDRKICEIEHDFHALLNRFPKETIFDSCSVQDRDLFSNFAAGLFNNLQGNEILFRLVDCSDDMGHEDPLLPKKKIYAKIFKYYSNSFFKNKVSNMKIKYFDNSFKNVELPQEYQITQDKDIIKLLQVLSNNFLDEKNDHFTRKRFLDRDFIRLNFWILNQERQNDSCKPENLLNFINETKIFEHLKTVLDTGVMSEELRELKNNGKIRLIIENLFSVLYQKILGIKNIGNFDDSKKMDRKVTQEYIKILSKKPAKLENPDIMISNLNQLKKWMDFCCKKLKIGVQKNTFLDNMSCFISDIYICTQNKLKVKVDTNNFFRFEISKKLKPRKVSKNVNKKTSHAESTAAYHPLPNQVSHKAKRFVPENPSKTQIKRALRSEQKQNSYDEKSNETDQNQENEDNLDEYIETILNKSWKEFKGNKIEKTTDQIMLKLMEKRLIKNYIMQTRNNGSHIYKYIIYDKKGGKHNLFLMKPHGNGNEQQSGSRGNQNSIIEFIECLVLK
ncbi:MAG: hypothetical protein GY830_08400 [Bacteroidetes bacterium]|nr:hypothetical protein [Bacteroidota bacterium]